MTRLMVAFALFASACKKPAPPAPPPTPAPVAAPAPAPAPAPVVEMAKNFTRVYFDFDSASLSGSSKSALSENVGIMQNHDDIKLEVQGHADERGTTDYNLALGQRRANAVVRYMKSSGIPASRLKVVSYGEERPMAGGSSESSWSQNRRAEFVITYKGSANVKGTNE